MSLRLVELLADDDAGRGAYCRACCRADQCALLTVVLGYECAHACAYGCACASTNEATLGRAARVATCQDYGYAEASHHEEIFQFHCVV